MKKLPLVTALSTLLFFECAPSKDTNEVNLGVRLSRHVTARSMPACGETIQLHDDALRLLAFDPQCTDKVIESLQWIAKWDPGALTDLAAAYFVRAKRQDKPWDVLHAFDAADRAVKATPNLAAARFNRAVALETLGLRDEALAAWDHYLKLENSLDGRHHRNRLALSDAETRWNENSDALMATRDRAALAKLIAPYPSSVMRYVRFPPGTADRAQLRLLAQEVSRITGERSLTDAMRLMDGADTARVLSSEDIGKAFALLDKLESEAAQHPIAIAYVQLTRGFCELFQSHYGDALLAYEAALKTSEGQRDTEGIFTAHVRKAGVLRMLGQKEKAWRELNAAIPNIPAIVERSSRHAFFGEAATAASDLGHPEVALLYQNAAVKVARVSERGIALRGRAEAELGLGLVAEAARDIAEAKEIARNEPDAVKRAALETHIRDVEGRVIMPTDPARAVEAFTAALNAAGDQQLKTHRATLLIERAEAQLKAGRKAEAEGDLRSALAELRDEENRNVQKRSGLQEQDWSAYFSRFQSAYRTLIRQLVDDQRTDEAFDYAEKARAYDLLNLVKRRDLDAMTIPQLQAAIPTDTYIIEYCVLDDRTYAWIVTNSRVQFFPLDVARKTIENWSRVLLSAADRRDHRAFEKALHAPYGGLIAPLLLSIRKPARFVIIPDGAMYGLPFAALRDASTKRFLIQEGTVVTAASAKMYLFSLARDASMPRDADPSLLLIGDPAFDERLGAAVGLARLPRAKAEVLSINAEYGERGIVRTGAEATVPEFLAHAPESTIVHVAAHAIPNAQEPLHSLLLLAPSPGHSGAIDAEQLLKDLRLDHTRLVVLSACGSAGGVAPLVRPVIAAGVPAVIGSLWEVDDATAEPLLVSFHRQYRQGSDAANALRNAQLAMLNDKNPGLRSVLAWAPFQVIGHASSPLASPRQK